MSLHKAVDPDDWLRAIKKKQLKNPSVTISIEDIMQQTCGDGKDSKPPKQKLRPTSPRSLQACLQLGIHPAELEWKPASCFEETGDGGTEAAEVKQKFYNKLRMERLEKLSEERRKIIDEMSGEVSANSLLQKDDSMYDGFKTPKLKGSSNAFGTSANKSSLVGFPKTGMRPISRMNSSSHSQSYLDSSLDNVASVETERKRLEVLRKRQEKELEQMVNYEATRQAMQSAAQEKVKQQRARDLAEKKEKAARERDRQRQQREKEMIRLAEEEKLEQEARRQAALRYHAEQEQLRKDRERYQKLQKESHMRDLERMHKAEEARRITELILVEQQKQLQKRQKDIEMRDIERQRNIKLKRDILAKENEEKRRQAQFRLEQAANNNRIILRNKRNAYEEKTKANELRRMEHEAVRKATAEEKRDTDFQRERRRKEMFEESQEIERRRIETIQKKQEEAERTLQKVKKERESEMMNKRMHAHLLAEEKMAKVESMRRQQAYHKEQALTKIEEETQRTRRLLEERLMLREKRKMANVQSSFMRQQLMEAIEKLQVKKAWCKVDLTNGKQLTLDQLQAVVSGPPSPWRGLSSANASRSTRKSKGTSRAESRADVQNLTENNEKGEE